ncbi:hypothetical protein Tco_0485385 [Tanacetum coccineum]
MDPNSSLGRICLGDDVIVISSDKAEGSGDWNSLEYQDTAVSKGKEVINGLSFYRMETDEISERYIAQCFVNGLEAFDGEINLAFDENLISNEFAVKLCLDYEVKKGKKISQRYALLEEERLVIETMAYNDKYKMILDEIWKDKVELDGKTVKEDEDAVKRIKGEALKEKEDLGAFIFPIRLEGKVNENALAEAASFDVLRTTKSDSDDEEEYVIKRNKFGAPIYGPRPAPYLNCANPEDRSSAIHATSGTHDGEVGSSRSKRSRNETVEELLLPQVHHEFLLWEGCTRDAKSRVDVQNLTMPSKNNVTIDYSNTSNSNFLRVFLLLYQESDEGGGYPSKPP